MNRRSFLTRFGTAAIGAAALAIDDPERLLWTPGKKTIIDFGATKHVLPATDEELVSQATQRLLSSPRVYDGVRREAERIDRVLRDQRLDMRAPDGRIRSFTFHDDKLVGVYSEADMKLLGEPAVTIRGVTRDWVPLRRRS